MQSIVFYIYKLLKTNVVKSACLGS